MSGKGSLVCKELEKMGANVESHNPQQATITGCSPLKGAKIKSCDIRAGAAMVLAALIAEGTTEISNIRYIDRGYEALDEKLRSLGAKIQRVENFNRTRPSTSVLETTEVES